MASNFENIRAVEKEMFKSSEMVCTDSVLRKFAEDVANFSTIEAAIDELLSNGDITPKDIATIHRFISHFETSGQLKSPTLARFREGVLEPEVVEIIAPLSIALRVTCKTARDMYVYACTIKNRCDARLQSVHTMSDTEAFEIY